MKGESALSEYYASLELKLDEMIKNEESTLESNDALFDGLTLIISEERTLEKGSRGKSGDLICINDVGVLHATLAFLFWCEIGPQLQQGVCATMQEGMNINCLTTKLPITSLKRMYRKKKEEGKYSERRLLKYILLVKDVISLGHALPFLTSTYLPYIYGALLQLEASKDREKVSDINSSVLLPLDARERGECRQEINKIINTFPLNLSIEALASMMFQRKIAPVWLTGGSAYWVSVITRRKFGIIAALDQMLGHIDIEETEAKFRVADWICRMPKRVDSPDSFHSDICSQIVELYSAKDVPLFRYMSALLTCQYCQIYPLSVIEKYILRPLFRPLYAYRDALSKDCDILTSISFLPTNEFGIIYDDETINIAIDNLSHLLSITAPSSSLINALSPIIPSCIMLYFAASKRKSNLTSTLKLVVEVLMKLDPNIVEIIVVLPTYAFSSLIWSAGRLGGVSLRKKEKNEENTKFLIFSKEIETLWSEESKLLVPIIGSMKEHDLAGELLTSLLRRYMFQVIAADKGEMEETEEEKYELQCNNFLLMSILSEIGPDCLKNGVQAVECVHSIMEGIMSAITVEIDIRPTTNDSIPSITVLPLKEINSEMRGVLNLCFGILEMLFNVMLKVDHDTMQALRLMIPTLQSLMALDPIAESAIVKSAQSIASQIYTYSSTKNKKNSHSGATSDDEQELVIRMINNALRDLKDPLVPIRAHGVNQLSEIIIKHQTVVESHLPFVINLLETMLLDSDSYVYLGAILGLTVAGEFFPVHILPTLLTRFCDSNAPLNQRLKIGEALSKITRKNGISINKFSQRLINGYLYCISLRNYEGMHKNRQSKENLNEEELCTFRASCLVNMGEIFEHLKWGISSHINDIMSVITGVLTMERNKMESVIVRRSAVYMLYKILSSGSGSAMFSILGGNEGEIFDLLTSVNENDPDSIVRGHASACVKKMEEAFLKG